MNIVDIDFGPNPGPMLARYGLKLAAARGILRLRADSFLEAPTAVLTALSQGELIQVGAFCSLAGGKIGNVRVGRYTSIGPEVVIGSHEHPTDWLTSSRLTHVPQMHGWHEFCAGPKAADLSAKRRKFFGSCPVTEIGNDVWIGQGVFIKAGVKIGDGAVIGARSVVTKDIPPYAMCVGAPAKPRRLRFPEPLVARLLAFKWWRFSLYDLYGVEFENPEKALDIIEARAAKGEVAEYAAPRYTPFELQDLVAKPLAVQ